MKTVDLSKVLEMLINEEHSEASGLLHEWFVEASKKVHEDLMQEDASLSQDIEDDQEAIETEEFYNEADEESDAGVEEVPGDEDADLEPGAEIEGPAEVDAEVSLGDTIEDLEAVMARLKAEFAEITGADVGGDEVAGDDVVGDEFGSDEEFGAEDDMGDDMGGDVEAADETYAFESAEVDEDADEDADEVTESDNFDDLEESWTLEPVKDPNLQGGKEIGADGAKVALNDKSSLPEHDADARVGGKAVEIKSDHHEGHEREPSPEVKARPLLKNQVKKSTDGRSKVSKEGDKSAMLNSKAGFGSDSPKSPIGQATDLRGSNFKRK